MPQISCDQVAAKIDSYRDQALGWLQEMIRHPSTQGNEAGVQAYIKSLFEGELGLPAEYREIPDSIMQDPDYCHNESECSYAGRHNLVSVQEGGGAGCSLIIQSHADVVPGDDWDGYTPRWDGEYVTGRGAMDCKGQIVMILLALRTLKELGYQPAGRIETQIVIEEEPGGNGALSLIRQGCQADACVVCEASSMNVFPANRGAVWFRATTTGVATHMGRRHEGMNAIEKMMEAIKWMLVYENELIAASKGNPLFDRYASPVQLCLGMIHGGQWPSRVCDKVEMEGGVGFLPNKTIAQIKQELWDAVMRTDDEWLKAHFTLEYPKLKKDAYQIDPNHPFVTTFHGAVTDCGIESDVYGWNVSCDAALYAQMAGIPTIVYGVADIGSAHGADEKVRFEDIITAAQGLAMGIVRWCG